MKLGLVPIALLLASCATSPPPLDPGLREKIDQAAGRLVERPENSCLAVGVLRDGVPTVLGYGRISESNPAPPDGDTVFEIGSVTKTFTATLLLQEVLAGRLALTEPIDQALPQDIRRPSRNGKPITYLDLATHRSGLHSIPANLHAKDASNPYADYTENDLFEALDTDELDRDPGESYEYSNFGVGLLGTILARVNQKSYEALVIDRICTPLNMKDTRITVTDDQKRRLAPGHDSSGRPVPNWEWKALAGAGAICSTTHDLLRYLSANLGEAYAGAHTPNADLGRGLQVGLCWHRIAKDGAPMIWHDGGTGGYRSFVGFVRETRTAVVVLSNGAKEVDTLGFALLKLLQDVK